MRAPRTVSARPPIDMSSEAWERIRSLPSATRDRVLERAAILIYDGGLSPAVADARALREEVG
jgi:hypothetical protein